jgi:tetrahydromethanopterin S-methyltransferase subunit F
MSNGINATAIGVSTASSGARALRAIVGGGLLGGFFDITFACVVWAIRAGVTPIRVGQSVASGLLGREAALAGGVSTGILGLVLHFVMAMIMAAVYYGAATRIPLLVKHAVPCGLAYGLGIYCVMNFVVLPLSAIGKMGGNGPLVILIPEILVHMVGVGLTIALFTRAALTAKVA